MQLQKKDLNIDTSKQPSLSSVETDYGCFPLIGLPLVLTTKLIDGVDEAIHKDLNYSTEEADQKINELRTRVDVCTAYLEVDGSLAERAWQFEDTYFIDGSVYICCDTNEKNHIFEIYATFDVKDKQMIDLHLRMDEQCKKAYKKSIWDFYQSQLRKIHIN